MRPWDGAERRRITSVRAAHSADVGRRGGSPSEPPSHHTGGSRGPLLLAHGRLSRERPGYLTWKSRILTFEIGIHLHKIRWRFARARGG